MFEPDIQEEALRLIVRMAEVLKSIEDACDDLPDDEILRAAIDMHAAVALDKGKYNDSAQQFIRCAYNAIAEMRAIIAQSDAALIRTATGFLEDAAGGDWLGY